MPDENMVVPVGDVIGSQQPEPMMTTGGGLASDGAESTSTLPPGTNDNRSHTPVKKSDDCAMIRLRLRLI